MNLELFSRRAIQPLVPESNVQLYIYNNKTTNDSGEVVVTWSSAVNITAQVQLENKQNLMHIDGINLTKIYKRFYIQSNTLTGLNRNLSTGGDYIGMDGLFYKIIEVVENFKVGWVQVIGCETNTLGGA